MNGLNPFMPLWEHVPDGEPRLFGNRVYLYGSHDSRHGTEFCSEDYVCWSAPAEDLTRWRCDGVIYRKEQDPYNKDGRRCMYAPDVVHTGYTVGGRFWSVDDRPLLGNCDGENFDYTEVRFKVEKHAMRICRIKE